MWGLGGRVLVLMGKCGINLGNENPFPGTRVSLGFLWSILVS